MEAVQIRRRGAEDFASYYESLCALQDTCPVASIRAGVKEGVLTCPVYRLKKADWHPLLTALQINKALHTVVFHDRWEDRVYPTVRKLRDGKRCMKLPPRARGAIDKNDISSIARSAHECLRISSALKSLVFEGLQLSLKDCRCLAKGLLKNSSLTHISFKGSGIQDSGVEVLCNAVKNSTSLEWLDLTACNITSQGATAIAALIKHQCLYRQSAAWKDSLRFRKPQLSQMSGLRRVTLNLNNNIGDRGGSELAEALRDDVCLKALDLQSCGVTTEGAEFFQEILKLNTCLIVLDLRGNSLIDDDVLDAIHEQLSINVAGMDKTEESYVWLEVEAERITDELSHAKVPRVPVRRPSTQRMGTNGRNGRCKGIPWRMAARNSQRWRRLVTTKSSWSHPTYSSISGEVQSTGSVPMMGEVSSSHTPTSTIGDITGRTKSDVLGDPHQSEVVVISAEEFKQLQVEITLCRRKLKEESAARVRNEVQMVELEAENRSLREQLQIAKEGHCSVPSTTVLNDEQALEAIESTFKQFSAFLDLLHEKGLGQLCELLEAQ